MATRRPALTFWSETVILLWLALTLVLLLSVRHAY
jgi:hypothetical protein